MLNSNRPPRPYTPPPRILVGLLTGHPEPVENENAGIPRRETPAPSDPEVVED